MINENAILKLSKDVFKRYENNIDDGKLFLYNFVDDKSWVGNNSSNDLLIRIDGKTSLKEVYSSLLPLFDGHEFDDVISAFNSVVNNLIENGFLEVLDG